MPAFIRNIGDKIQWTGMETIRLAKKFVDHDIIVGDNYKVSLAKLNQNLWRYQARPRLYMELLKFRTKISNDIDENGEQK